MLVRDRLAISVAILAAAALWALPGCSTNNPRDVNYGTDVALDFIPPDAAAKKDAAAVEVSGNSVDGSDLDGGVSQDSQMAEALTEVSVDGLQVESVSDSDAAIAGAN
jgi:hypothetical protein